MRTLVALVLSACLASPSLAQAPDPGRAEQQPSGAQRQPPGAQEKPAGEAAEPAPEKPRQKKAAKKKAAQKKALRKKRAKKKAVAPPPSAQEQPAPPPSAKPQPAPLPPAKPRLELQQPEKPPQKAEEEELLPSAKQPTVAESARADERARALAKRRSLLTLHQTVGIATLLSLTATVIIGRLDYDDKYGGGGDTGKYVTAHEVVAIGASAIFATAGILALLAPTPVERPLRLDTATVHKTAMAIATAGMVTQLVLGFLTAGREGRLSQRGLADAHQVVGIATLLATTTGFVVLSF
jgi:hypothetical protein